MTGTLLWNNPSIHCVYPSIHCYAWFNKQIDWSIAKQRKLGGKVKLRILGGGERVESKVSAARWGTNQ